MDDQRIEANYCAHGNAVGHCRTCELEEELRSLREERDALAAWACRDCGARFPQTRRPFELDGVTRCSSCVRAESAEAELQRLREKVT
jgi:hypothetical protein